MAKRKQQSSGIKWKDFEIAEVIRLRGEGKSLANVTKGLNEKFQTRRTEFAVFHVLKENNLSGSMKQNMWRPEELNFLVENNDTSISIEKLTEMLNTECNSKRTVNAVSAKILKLGIKRNHWSSEEVDFLQDLLERNYTIKKTTSVLNNKFKKNRSMIAVKYRLYVMGVRLLTPFERHNYITMKKVCLEHKISDEKFYATCKKNNIQIQKRDKNVLLDVHEYEKFNLAIKNVIDEITEISKTHFTLAEASKFLNMSHERIRGWIKHGHLKTTKLYNKHYVEKDTIRKLKIFLLEYDPITTLADKYFYSVANIKLIIEKNNIPHEIFRAETHVHKKEFDKHIKQKEVGCVWLPSDIDLLKATYKKYDSNKQIMKEFNKLQPDKLLVDIENKLKELRLLSDLWSPEEVDLLKDLTPQYITYSEVLDEFNRLMSIEIDGYNPRNLCGVTSRIRKLKLKLKQDPDKIWTVEDIENLKRISTEDSISIIDIIRKFQQIKYKALKNVRAKIKELGLDTPYVSQLTVRHEWAKEDIDLLKQIAKGQRKSSPIPQLFNEKSLIPRTHRVIVDKLSDLGLSKDFVHAWTDAEIDVLTRLVPMYTTYDTLTEAFNLEAHTDRTKYSVINKVTKLGLKLTNVTKKKKAVDITK